MARRSLPASDPIDGFSWQSEREVRHGRQPLLWANRQYLRLGTRPLEVAGDSCLRVPGRTPHHCSDGSFSESLSSLTTHPTLAAPFLEVPSPSLSGSPSGGSRTPSVSSSCSRHCQLLTEARSPKDLHFAGRNISELTFNLTFIPVRDALTLFVPAACWLSLQPQPIGGRDGRKKEKECVGKRRQNGTD